MERDRFMLCVLSMANKAVSERNIAEKNMVSSGLKCEKVFSWRYSDYS